MAMRVARKCPLQKLMFLKIFRSLALLLTLSLALAPSSTRADTLFEQPANGALDGWEISNAAPRGVTRLSRFVSLKAGQLLTVSAHITGRDGAKLRVSSAPQPSSYPLGSEQEFAMRPLPTAITAVVPAARDGEYLVVLNSESPFEVCDLKLESARPNWFGASAKPTLVARDVAPLPRRWSNAQGQFLSGQGGTVALQLTPDWMSKSEGKRGGIFDAYLALRMTADARDWTTYFMIMPPGTDAGNAAWERSHQLLKLPLTIGDAPDGWQPAAARLDDGKAHFVAFTWREFERGGDNFLYSSYFVDGQTWNAVVTRLGDQMVAPDPAALWLGSLGGQPAAYDDSPPALMGARALVVGKNTLDGDGLRALMTRVQSGQLPQTAAAQAVPVTDSTARDAVVNGGFELGDFGWGGKFVDTIGGHPHGSWHGQPATSIGFSEVWRAAAGVGGSAGLDFDLSRYSDKPLQSVPFRLAPHRRYNLSAMARADAGARVQIEVENQGFGTPIAATLAGTGAPAWAPLSSAFETGESESDWYVLRLRVVGTGRAQLDDVRVAGNRAPAGGAPLLQLAVAVETGGVAAPDGIAWDDAPIHLRVRATGTAPVRLRAQDAWGRVFYDQTKTVAGTLLWPVPPLVKGFWRVRVESGDAVAETPVYLVSCAAASADLRPDAFWGSEWLPTDQANLSAQKLGLKWTKLMNVGTGYGWWNNLEPAPGHWLWESNAANIKLVPGLVDNGDNTNFSERIRALRARGVLGMLTIVGAPDWANAGATNANAHDDFPADVAAWEKAVATIALHYKGLVPAYEIWNEPGWWDNNAALQKSKNYADYANDIVLPAIRAIRRTDPSAKIVYQFYFNQMSDDDKALQAQILQRVDVVSTHNYFNDLPPDEDGNAAFFADIAQTVEAARAAGNPNLQLWNTEGGVRAGNLHQNRAADGLEFPRAVPFETLRRAAQVPKAAVLMRANGYAKWFYYFAAGPVGGPFNPSETDTSFWPQLLGGGQPSAAGALTATYAGLMRDARFVKVIEKNARVKFYLFQTAGGPRAFYWGTNFGRETGDLTLRAPAAPRVLDMMGTPLALAQNAAGAWDLPLSNLVNALEAPTISQLETTINALEVARVPGRDFDAVMATPFTEKFDFAKRAAGEQWFQVDLSKQANMGLADETANDGRGGWTDEGPENDLRYFPTGLLDLYGVPFRIVDPATSGGKAVITLRAGAGPGTRTNRPEFPRAVTIPVGRRSNALYFLTAAGWASEKVNIANLTVRYADGQSASVPLTVGQNLLNWWDTPLANSENSRFVPARKDRFLYAVQWLNPRPDAPIESVEFAATGQSPAIPVLLAISGHGAG